MKAKQLLSLLLALLMVVTMFVSCGDDKGTETDPPSKETNGPSTGNDETEITDDLGDAYFGNEENPTITFFVRSNGGCNNEVWVEAPGVDDLNDAIYWRNQTIKERLGVTITQIAQPGNSGSDIGTWNETLRSAVQNRTHDYDATMFYTGAASSLATEGCYMDLTELEPISLEKPWWNQDLLKQATIYDSLYFASGYIAHSQIRRAALIWYNKNLYNEWCAASGKKDIYQVVRDNEWTIDYMYELTSAVHQDNDSNGEMSSGDVVGFGGDAKSTNGHMNAWLYALGCDLTQMNESTGLPEACFYNEHTIQAHDALVRLYAKNDGAFVEFSSAASVGDTKFTNGNVMMTLGTFKEGEGYRDLTFDFGVLPLPMFDGEQDGYRTITEGISSMVAVLSTVEDNRLEMVASTVELMAAESYKTVIPTYIDSVLKSKQANSPEDAEMVQTVIDSLVYSFGWIFSDQMNKVQLGFRTVDGSLDLAKDYGEKGEVYKSNIEDLLLAFEALQSLK